MSDALFEFLRSFSPAYASDAFAPAMKVLGYTPLPWLVDILSFANDNVYALAHQVEVASAALPIPAVGIILAPVIGALDVLTTLALFTLVIAAGLWTIALGMATYAVLLAAGMIVVGADLVLGWAVQLRDLAGHRWM